MKVSLAQYDVARGDPEANLKKIHSMVSAASGAGSDLVCLPEMATTGFDWRKNRELLERAPRDIARVAEIAAEFKVDICGSFLEQTEEQKAANTLHYIDSGGGIRAKYRKIHLFTLFHEELHVTPGHEATVLDACGTKVGFGVCYDLRFPELFRKNTALGAKIQILPAAFPHPRLEHWRTLVRARAIENQCYFIAVNQCGTEGHGEGVGSTKYFGNSMVIDPWGETVIEAGEEAGLYHAEIDLHRVDETRQKLPALKDRRPELY